MLRAEKKSFNWEIWNNVDKYYWLTDEHDLAELTSELNKIPDENINHTIIKLISGLDKYNKKNTYPREEKGRNFLKIFNQYLVKLELLNNAFSLELPYLDKDTARQASKFNAALDNLTKIFDDEFNYPKAETYRTMLLDQAKEKLENEILLLQICGRIENQIKRLKKDEKKYRILKKPCSDEIFFLILLKQLLLIPADFSEKERLIYFGEKTKRIIFLPDLITNLINHNQDGLPKNAEFLASLLKEFSSFYFSLCKPRQYRIKTSNHSVLGIGEIQFYFDKKKQELIYQVISPQAEIIKESIGKKRLEKQFGPRTDAFYEIFNNKKPLRHIQPFLSDIMQITAKREHTYGAHSFRQFNTITYITRKNTPTLSDKMQENVYHLLNKEKRESPSPGILFLDNVDNLLAEDLLKKVIAHNASIQKFQTSDDCSSAENNILGQVDFNLSEFQSRFRIQTNSFVVKNDINEDLVLSSVQETGQLRNHRHKEKSEHTDNDAVKEDEFLTILFAGYDGFISKKNPSYKMADKKLKKLLKDIVTLMEKGRTQFLVCNSPDFSKSPYFLKKTTREQLNANLVIQYFNHQLSASLVLLKKQYPHFSFDIFNLYDFSHKIINHSDKYGFKTEYKMAPLTPSHLPILQLYTKGCGFVRMQSSQTLLNFSYPNTCSYIRRDNALYFTINKELEIILLRTDQIKEFDNAIPYQDPVQFLTDSELERIKEITGHNYKDSFYKTKYTAMKKEKLYAEKFIPERNTIYYQINDRNALLEYYVVDGCDRLRFGEITKFEITLQINTCSIVRVMVPPLNSRGNLTVELTSRETYIRYKDELFYVYITNNDEEKIIRLDTSAEILEKFDKKFKPWFMPRILKQSEIDKIGRLLGKTAWHDDGECLLTPDQGKYFQDHRSIIDCRPAIQAILADKGHANAKGDIFTPIKDSMDVQNYLLDFGMTAECPLVNKIFHDDLFYSEEASRWMAKFIFRHIQLTYKSAISLKYFENFSKSSLPVSSFLFKKPCEENVYSREKRAEMLHISEAELITEFHARYYKMLAGHSSQFFSAYYRASREGVSQYHSLEKIFNLSRTDKYVYKVLVDMEWITKDNELTPWAKRVPVLAKMNMPRDNLRIKWL